MMMDDEIVSQGSSGSEDTPVQEAQPMTFPINHASGWMDHAVLGIATACNLCDVYVHEQVRFEWDTEERERLLSDQDHCRAPFCYDAATSVMTMDKKLQIDLYKKFLFDESSIRFDDDFLDDTTPSPMVLSDATAADAIGSKSTQLLLDTAAAES